MMESPEIIFCSLIGDNLPEEKINIPILTQAKEICLVYLMCFTILF